MTYYVYIIECGDRTYYTGYTIDIIRRFNLHLMVKEQNIQEEEHRWNWCMWRNIQLNQKQ